MARQEVPASTPKWMRSSLPRAVVTACFYLFSVGGTASQKGEFDFDDSPPPGARGPGPGAGDQKEATEISTATFGRRKNEILKCWNDLTSLVALT